MRASPALLLMLVAGCATVDTPPHYAPPHAAFVQSEYAAYDSAGTSAIAGRGCASTPAGVVRCAVERPVYLTPVTAYSTAWWDRAVVGDDWLANRDSRAARYFRTAKTDSSGLFSFEDLPAGEYYVMTSVFWPSGPAPLPFQTDVAQSVLGKRVKVGVGERVEVVLETTRTTERIWKRR
jgi:hypothetical protein